MLSLLVLASLTVHAAPPAGIPGRIEVKVDNDLPFADRHYTSGLFLDARLPSGTTLPGQDGIRRIVDRGTAPLWGRARYSRVYLKLGQELYTPKFYWFRQIQDYDRPFAGWLYARGGLEISGPRQVLEVDAAMGPVGRNALGRQAQDFSHDYVSVRSPRSGGWGNQLRLGMGVQTAGRWTVDLLVLDRADVRLFALSTALSLDVGNLRIQSGAGLFARVGWFGQRAPTDDLLMRALLGALGVEGLTMLFHRAELSFFVGVTPRWVGHNGFLEGLPAVNSMHTVEALPFNAEITGGWTLALWNLRLETAMVWQSPRADLSFDVGHQYWTIRATAGF